MNNVILIGYLGGDAESRTTQGEFALPQHPFRFNGLV